MRRNLHVLGNRPAFYDCLIYQTRRKPPFPNGFKIKVDTILPYPEKLPSKKQAQIMAKPRATMQLAFRARPWVRGTIYTLLSSPLILHADIYAYYEEMDVYFVIEYREAGTRHLASHWFWRDPIDGALCELLAQPDAKLAPLYWDGDTHAMFRAAHGALLASAKASHDASNAYNRLSVHCHYVRVRMRTTWPRGFVNHYRARADITERPGHGGKRPGAGRPSKAALAERRAREAEIALSEGRMPDWEL